MATTRSQPTHRPLRNEISFKQLVLIVREQEHVGPTTDELAWKERIELRVHSLGFRYPKAGQVYAAMEAVQFVDRKMRRTDPPLSRGSSGFTPRSSLSPKLPANACGSSKPVTGARPLRCMKPRGHDGDHGVQAPSGEWFIRWSR